MSLDSMPVAKNYEEMNFVELEQDEVARAIVNEESLNWSRTEDKEYFEREFTGELDPEGYLIRRSGGAGLQPSGIIPDPAMETIAERVRERLRKLQ